MNNNGILLSDVVPAKTEEAAVAVVQEQVSGAHVFVVKKHVPRMPMVEEAMG